ncbi:N-acyl homoserine lactonase family protein [uncultured Sphingomonas sp.]|uniref:N-acyl homoserine lactonase family protein n=1 Tax=uncultured Sphingomonas sp. TaxID=158754 RepID=UPI0035CA4392
MAKGDELMPASPVPAFPRDPDDAGVRLFAFTCGHITLPLSFFLRGEDGQITIPVTAYLIDHPAALCLFDTGLGAKYRRPTGTPGTGRVDFSEHETIAARLAEIGVAAQDIRWIINSHLHLDHAGGNAHLPNATIIIQDSEWDFARAGIDPSYVAGEVDTGQPVQRITGEFDLFGDNTVVLMPTPGHTPGHQSARVRTLRGDVLLAGDCCNLKRSLDELRLPDHCHDADSYLDSLKMLRREREKGTAILFSHDPDFWATIPQARPLGVGVAGKMADPVP